MTGTDAPDFAAIQAELQNLAVSKRFARSTSLLAMLQYVVNESIEGRADTLKELVIGDALYGHRQPYDPRIDSTVRVEARRLRRKLNEFYTMEGADRPIRIEIPVGGYRPSFRSVSQQEPAASRKVGAFATGVDLAILPFRALSPNADDDRFADGLTDEIIFACGALSGLRVAPRVAIFQYKNRTYSLSEAAVELSAAMVLHGTIRTDGSRSRVTVEIADPLGFVVWSDRMECLGCESIGEQEKLACAIADRLPSVIPGCTRQFHEIARRAS